MVTHTERVLGLVAEADQETDRLGVGANKDQWKEVAEVLLIHKVNPMLLNIVHEVSLNPRCQIMIRFSYPLRPLLFHNSNSRYHFSQ